MHRAVYLYTIDARTMSRIVSDEFVPLISPIPGSIAYYMIDLEHDEGMMLAIFRDDAGLQRFKEVAQAWFQNRIIAERGVPNDPPPVLALTGRVIAFHAPDERGQKLLSARTPMLQSSVDRRSHQGEHMILTRIAANEDGESYFDDVELTMSTAIVADGVPPLRVSPPVPVTAAFFVEPPGGTHDWQAHVAPRRQFVVVVVGRVAVETTDGARREFGPGEFVLTEDTTGRGHRTIPLTTDLRLMMVPLAG